MNLYLNYCYIFIISLFLFACSTKTGNQSPSIKIPAEWENHYNGIRVDDQIFLPELAWWQAYHDTQLNELIDEALKNNNHLAIAIANLDYARGQLKQVQLNWIPGVSIWAGSSQMPNLGDPGYFWGLFPLYTLNIFQQIKKQESAEHQLEASQYAKDGVRLTVIGQVSGAYFTLLAQEQMLTYYEDLLENNQKLLTLYQSQYQTGIISQNKWDQQNSVIHLIQSQIIVTQHNIFVSKNALHYLLNQNPGDMKTKNRFKYINSNTTIPGNFPATVLNNRPDIQESKALLKEANANIGVAQSNLLPSVRLDTFLGNASNMSGFVTLNEAYANIPVINAPVLGQIESNQAAYKAAYIRYIDTIRKALQEVNDDLSAYSAFSQQLQNNELAWQNKKQQCILVHSRYKNGIDSQVEELTCQINLDEFSLLLTQNKLKKMMAITALYQDLAGGYKYGV